MRPAPAWMLESKKFLHRCIGAHARVQVYFVQEYACIQTGALSTMHVQVCTLNRCCDISVHICVHAHCRVCICAHVCAVCSFSVGEQGWVFFVDQVRNSWSFRPAIFIFFWVPKSHRFFQPSLIIESGFSGHKMCFWPKLEQDFDPKWMFFVDSRNHHQIPGQKIKGVY